jgi:hypothetical protein
VRCHPESLLSLPQVGCHVAPFPPSSAASNALFVPSLEFLLLTSDTQEAVRTCNNFFAPSGTSCNRPKLAPSFHGRLDLLCVQRGELDANSRSPGFPGTVPAYIRTYNPRSYAGARASASRLVRHLLQAAMQWLYAQVSNGIPNKEPMPTTANRHPVASTRTWKMAGRYSSPPIQSHGGFRSSSSSASFRVSSSSSMACRRRSFASSMRPATLA